MSPSESESLLNGFQRNALDTLEAREALARSNMLTVKVKLSKGLKLKGVSKVAKLTVNVDIYSTADELATEIASKLLVIQGKLSLKRIQLYFRIKRYLDIFTTLELQIEDTARNFFTWIKKSIEMILI